jgi:hypothetical protein
MRARSGAPAALLLLLLALAAAAALTTAADAADAAAATTTPSPRVRRWRGLGLGNWRRRRRAVALADAIIAGAKESAAVSNNNGLSAAARAAAAAADAAAPPARTQAGCPCLKRWTFGSIDYAQCANPNRDPNGYWCAVDQSSCPGYYGAFSVGGGAGSSAETPTATPTPTTQLLAFDYCVGTDASGEFWPGPRERTTSGCLCQSGRWTLALPGEDSAQGGALGPSLRAGKSGYHDRCAQPGGLGTARQCVVDVRTCPDPQALMSPSSPDADVVDSCPDLDDDANPETAAAAKEQRAAESYFASVPPEEHRTLAGCACDPGGWRYAYPDGTPGPLLKGCQNVDNDPLGPWCAVDPKICPWFAGEIRRGTGNATREQPGSVIAFDYCRLPNAAAESNPLAARLSRRAAALAERAREEMARVADLLARQRAAVKRAIDARGGEWLDGAAASADEAAAVLQRQAAEEVAGDANDDDASNSDPKAWASLPPSACRLEQLKPWDQCGGKSACGDWACADAAWPGRCCPVGFVCERQHAFYWQCVPPLAAASFGGDAAEAGAVAASAVGGGEGDLPPAAAEPQCGPAARRAREARAAAALAAGTTPPSPPVLLASLSQCGGLADCPDGVRGTAGCGDRPWPGFCCPDEQGGSVCRRQRGNPWYWQCLPQDQDGDGVLDAAGPAEGVVPPPLIDDGLRVPVSEPGPSLTPPPPLSPLAASGLVLEPESGAAQAPETANLSPGRGFVVSMRLDGDYDKLLAAADGSDASAAAAAAAAASSSSSSSADADGTTTTTTTPFALRRLKSGLVEVVTAAAAAPPGALYRVEVTGVQPGSILADVRVTFSAEADEGEVSRAYTRLRERAGPEYAASSLPARFGALEGLTISAEQGGELVPLARGGRGGGGVGGAKRAGARLAASKSASAASADSSTLRAGPGVDADEAFGRRKTVGVLGSGAIAGAAIGGLAGLLAAAFAVKSGAEAAAAKNKAGDGGANNANKGAQADKSAQLRYLAGEADEGELARELMAEGKIGPDEVVGGVELLREERARREREREGGGGGDSGGGKPWVGAWLEALERRGNGSRPLVAWPLRSPIVPSSPSSPVAAAAGAAASAFLPRGSSDAGGGAAAAADVAAYATAVPGPSGKVVPRRASKNGGV